MTYLRFFNNKPLQRAVCYRLLVLLGCWWVANALLAQKPVSYFVESVSTGEELQDKRILALEQDRAGFLWIGTAQGLHRYDGNQLRSFFSETPDSTSLSDNIASFLFNDRQQRLWVCTGNGICRFDARTSTFRRYFTWPTQVADRITSYIVEACDDHRGRIWFRNHLGDVYLLNPESGEVSPWKPSSTPQAGFGPMCRGTGNTLWLSTEQGIWQFDTQSETKRIFAPDRPNLEPPVAIAAAAPDALWVAFGLSTVGCLNPQTGAWTYFNVESPKFTGALLPDGARSVLLGSVNFAERHEVGERAGTAIYLPTDPDFDALIRDIFRDRSGITWFGTENGLFKLDPRLQGFQRVQVHGQTEGLSDNDITDVQLVPGTHHLLALSRDLNAVFVMRDQPEGTGFVRTISTKPYTQPNQFLRTRNGANWIVCAERLLRFDPVTYRLTPAPPLPIPEGQKFRLKHATEDAQGRLWLATFTDRIYIFDPATGQYEVLGPEQGLAVKRIVEIWIDRNGRYVWAGTDLNGLAQYDLTTRQFTHFKEKDAPGLNSTAFCQQDLDGNLWIGGDKGLLCYNLAKGSFELAFTHKNGLPASTLEGGKMDHNGDLWWGQGDRIVRVTPRTRTIKIFDHRYGLGRTPHRLMRFAHDPATGEMFVGMRGALTRWHPDSLHRNAAPPVVVNVACSYRNTVVLAPTDSVWAIGFDHPDNSFSLEFAALNFTLPQDNLYSWWIEGFSDEWSTPSRDRRVQANFVPPGKYRLWVRAANNDGVWNEPSQSILVVVHPAWWQTWWFRTLCALALAGAAYLFYRNRLGARERLEAAQLRAKDLEKQQLLNEIDLLKTQVNPHFLFNSLSILSSLVHVNADLSEQFIEQLARSYRYILEQKDQQLVTLRTELEFIQAYAFLLKIRFDNKFDLQIRLSEADLDRYQVAPLTLQLLVENAVKHNRMSAREPLVVEVVTEGDFLVVRNHLQLRPQPAASTGTGLNNILHRYALLTDRPVWAGEQEGDFVVRVPLV